MSNGRRSELLEQILVGLEKNPPIEKTKLEELKGALDKVISKDNKANRKQLDNAFLLVMVQQAPASLSKEVLKSLKIELEKIIKSQNERNFELRPEKQAGLKTSQETPTPPPSSRMTRGGG